MGDAAADLDDFLADQFTLPDDDDARQHFVIDNDRKAAWAQHRLALAEQRREELHELAFDRIALINLWLQEACHPLERDITTFTGMLSDYLRRLVDVELQPLLEQGLTLEAAWDQVRNKGHALPGGRLQARKAGGTIKVVDDNALLEWASDNHPELLRQKPPTITDLKAVIEVKDGHVLLDGIEVPGTTIEPVRINYGPASS